MSDQDKARYEQEMAEYNKTGFFTDKNGVNSSTLQKVQSAVKNLPNTCKIKQKKVNSQDPNIPRKVLCPFINFVKMKSREAMAVIGKPGKGELTKYLGNLWKNMTDLEKQPYLDMQA